jgi:hypothetical protein
MNEEENYDESGEFTTTETEEMYAEYEVPQDRERVDSHYSSKSSY